MLYLKKLKILFQYNSFFYLFFIFSLLFCFINVNYVKSESIFTNESKIEGVVIDKSYKNEKYTITLKSKEKIHVNYYSKKEIDLDFGDTILVKGKIIDPNNNTNFNLFNYKNYLLSKKIKKSFLASSLYIKQKNNNHIIQQKLFPLLPWLAFSLLSIILRFLFIFF